MNILILAMSMGHGGAETHVLTLSRALRRSGNEVTVASAGGCLVGALTAAGVRHVRLPLDRRSPLAVMRSASGIVSLCGRECFDVIHAHGRLPAFAAHIARRLSRTVPPAVVTVHGIYDPHAPGARFSTWGERTVAVSDDIADYTAATYRMPRAGIAVIPNGVEIPDTATRATRGGLDIVTTCRLDRDSCAAAMSLCRIFPDICREFAEFTPTLTVIGGGGMLGTVRAEAEKVNRAVGRDAVICPGASDDAAACAAKADIFVGTSRAALEAMAAGVPVILAGDAGCRGLLTPENLAPSIGDNLTCRTAAPTDTDTLILNGIRRFAETDSSGRAALGAFCRKAVKEHFDIDVTAARTLDVLREAAADGRRGIVMCGYYGAGNAGDDASLAAIVDGLSHALPDEPVRALCRGSTGAGIPPEAEPIFLTSPLAAAKALRTSRLLLLGGGSLLQNATSLRSLASYALAVRAARRRGCRVVIWGGVGPLLSPAARRIASRAVRSASAIYARDAAAAEGFAALGAKHVVTAADPALLTMPEPLPAGYIASLGIDGGYFMICPRRTASLRGAGGRKAEINAAREICAFSARFAAATGSSPVFSALSPSDDTLCRRLAAQCGGAAVLPAGSLTPGQLVTLMSGASLVMAERLHAAVFAALAGTPAVAVGYDPKVAGFAAAHAGTEYIPLDGLTADELFTAAESAAQKNGSAATAEPVEAARNALAGIAELYSFTK